MTDLYWSWYIRWLMLTDSARLFNKLYDLEWYRKLHEKWLDDLDCLAGQRLLEVGCGTGRLAEAALHLGLSVTAVDRSRRMLLGTRPGSSRGEHVEYRRAEVNRLPFGDGSFDYVIAASLINIVEDSVGALREMSRVVNVEGTVSYLVPGEAMSKANVARFISRYGLVGFSAQSLRAWGNFPPKMDRINCIETMKRANLSRVRIDEYLDGMVYVVTGEKPRACPMPRPRLD